MIQYQSWLFLPAEGALPGDLLLLKCQEKQAGRLPTAWWGEQGPLSNNR